MASQVHFSLRPTLLILSIILLLGGKASCGRIIPESSKEVDKKQPEFFFGSHGSIPIPTFGHGHGHGHGHFPLPHFPRSSGSSGGGTNFPGSSGSSGGGTNFPGSSGSSGGGTGSTGGYVPGGDDTSIPNPGVEIPNPGSGGGNVGAVQMATHP